jgi:hypothetical protein
MDWVGVEPRPQPDVFLRAIYHRPISERSAVQSEHKCSNATRSTIFLFLHPIYSPVPSSEVLREKTIQDTKYTSKANDTKMMSCRSYESSC